MTDAVKSLVERGYRRVVSQLAIDEVTLACTIALLGLVVALALGTDAFPLEMIWVFVLGGAALGLYRWTRRRPDPYQVAQRIDFRWHADDQVSTAFYFTTHAQEGTRWAHQQRRLAERLAGTVDLGAALPFHVSGKAWALAVVLSLGVGLLAVRYALQPALSLNSPLAPAVRQALWGVPEQEAVTPEEPSGQELRAANEPASPLSEQGEIEDDQARDEPESPASSSPDEASGESLGQGELPLPEVEGLSLEDEYGDELASGTDQLAQEASEEAESGAAASSAEAREPGESEGPSGEQDSSQESDDLLSRLQDAFRNMLSTLSLDPPQSGSRDEASQGGAEMFQQGAPSSDSPAGQSPQGGEGQSESEAGGSGAPEQPAELAEGKGGPESSGPGQEGQTTSSAGSNDGSKEITEAAQLEAMGELSELFNRRAAELTGEVMIETEASPQELQTPYAPRQAGHSDPGGAVSRDEIPVAYRAFIQSYFENLRKQNQN